MAYADEQARRGRWSGSAGARGARVGRDEGAGNQALGPGGVPGARCRGVGERRGTEQDRPA